MGWEDRALCGAANADVFFPETPGMERAAKAICERCPVRRECLASALASSVRFGIWGGLNERERRALARRFPGPTDWNAALKATGLRALA
ncbi:MAG: WhiB family transcriptional regulator [Actinomycetota bacterium]|nr:WhiB family transcriptional regulator [Actinomycetota bacterium]